MADPKMVPLVITDDFAATRSFYLERLGATLVMQDGDNYLQVRFGTDEDRPELAFCPPLPADSPIGAQPAYSQGVLFSIPVEDADAYRKDLVERGLDVPEPTDKPWRWRSFLLVDPSGVTLDFYHVLPDDAVQDAAS
jgi:catechol 2,3-dioxygenase-like lactoylglutathione lyase family enzyme